MRCSVPMAATLPPTARAQSSPPTLAELAMYSGPDRTERLIAGAKKEGVVNIYSSVTVDDMKVLTAAFEKKYGVKLQALALQLGNHPAARHGRIPRRALRGRRHRDQRRRDGIAASREAAAGGQVAAISPTSSRPRCGRIANGSATGSTSSPPRYNTNLIRKEDRPKTYEDLLDPKWKGKLGIEADDSVWFGALAEAMGEAEGDQALPRHCAHQWPVRAQGPHAARQPGHLRRGAVRAHRLSLQGRAVEEEAARRSTGTCCRRASLAFSAPA